MKKNESTITLSNRTLKGKDMTKTQKILVFMRPEFSLTLY